MKTYFFLEAVYQLEKTSDCIQIHPPGPGENLKKTFFPEHFDQKFSLRLAACRRRFFFAPNSVSLGKRPFSAACGLPLAPFFVFKIHPKISDPFFRVLAEKTCVFCQRRPQNRFGTFFGQKLVSITKTKFFCTSRVIPL